MSGEGVLDFALERAAMLKKAGSCNVGRRQNERRADGHVRGDGAGWATEWRRMALL
jgi:hypothetical protein